MPDTSSIILLTAYLLVLGFLSLFGLHRLWILGRYVWYRRNAARRPETADDAPAPFVTVQLPLYNERFVAERLLDYAAAIRHPRDRLEIQVLDDSTDDTTELIAAKVRALQAAGVPIVHLHRTDREGYKAGALEAGRQCRLPGPKKCSRGPSAWERG